LCAFIAQLHVCVLRSHGFLLFREKHKNSSAKSGNLIRLHPSNQSANLWKYLLVKTCQNSAPIYMRFTFPGHLLSPKRSSYWDLSPSECQITAARLSITACPWPPRDCERNNDIQITLEIIGSNNDKTWLSSFESLFYKGKAKTTFNCHL